MAVTALLDAVGAHLGGALGPGASVGVAHPAQPADLPAVSLALPEVTPSLPPLGRRPAPVRTGALVVETTLALDDPVLRFPGEDVRLLSADRRTLQLPHGAIVRADGTSDLPFTATDLLIRRGGTTFTPVTANPAAGQCRPDPDTGTVVFGSALPATGTLQLRYFVGTWEVRTERYAGALLVETFAGDAAAVATLSRAVEQALEPDRLAAVPGLHRLDPASVSSIAPAAPGNARRRTLTYRFDYEREHAVISTGGGPIRAVPVTLAPGPEAFTVLREGSSP